MSDEQINIIANRIASNAVAGLFQNGSGQQAKRLVLELENGRDGGGWSRKAAFDRIYEQVVKALEEAR